MLFPPTRSIRETIDGWNGAYFPVKGHVQSGKTTFMLSTCVSCVDAGVHVVVLLRNLNADRVQFVTRLRSVQAARHRPINVCSNAGRLSEPPRDPTLFVCLGNGASLRDVVRATLNTAFVLLIDEADSVDSGAQRKKNPYLHYLKTHAKGTIGVSATIMDVVAKQSVDAEQILVLPVPDDYKGFMDIQHVAITTDSIFSGRVDSDLMLADPGLEAFVAEFAALRVPRQPCIGLVNICRTKEPCYRAVRELAPRHPAVLLVVYNSDGIVWIQGNEREIEERVSISEFLQQRKVHGWTSNILIFSGDLAGRGISFVSSDYQWHLTHERLLVAAKCDEAEIQQKLRLLGRYADDTPLTLYARPELLEDLRRAYFRQEELLGVLVNSAAPTRQTLERVELHREKFTRRAVIKDPAARIKFAKTSEPSGWSLEVYAQNDLPPDEYYTRYGLAPPDTDARIQYRAAHLVIEEDATDEVVIVRKRPRIVMEEGRYAILEPERMSRGIKHSMTEEVMKQLIDRSKMGETVSRVDVNEWLLRMGRAEFKNVDQLNGNWNSIRWNQHSTDDVTHDGLLYWKEEERYYFRLNVA